MTIDIASHAAMTTAKPDAAGGASTQPTGFHQKLDPAANGVASTQPSGASATGNVPAASQVGSPSQANPLGKVDGPSQTTDVTQANAANRVNGADIPDQDIFGRFDQVRAEFNNYIKKSDDVDKLVADGKLRSDDPRVLASNREQMRMLLHFQTEMQSASVKVEIASKVVDHGTSGAKTILQTQA